MSTMRGYLRKGAGRQAKRRFLDLDSNGRMRYYVDDSLRTMKGEVVVAGGQVAWSGGDAFRVHCFPVVRGVTQTQVKILDLTAAHASTAEEWVVSIKKFTNAGGDATGGAAAQRVRQAAAVEKLALLMQYVVSSVGEPDEEAVDAVFNAPVSDVLVTRFVTLYSSYPLARGAKILTAVADIGVVAEAVKKLLLLLPAPLLPPQLYVDVVAAVCSDGAADHHVVAAVQQLLQLRRSQLDVPLLHTVCMYVRRFAAASEAQLRRLVHAFVPAFIPPTARQTQQGAVDAAFLRAAQQAPRVLSWLVRHAHAVFDGLPPSKEEAATAARVAARAGARDVVLVDAGGGGGGARQQHLLVDLTLPRKDMLHHLGELAEDDDAELEEDEEEEDPVALGGSRRHFAAAARGGSGSGSGGGGARGTGSSSRSISSRSSHRRLLSDRSRSRRGGRGGSGSAGGHNSSSRRVRGSDASRRIMLRPFGRAPLKAPTLLLLDAAAQQCGDADALRHILAAMTVLRAKSGVLGLGGPAGTGVDAAAAAAAAGAAAALAAVTRSFGFLTWQEACRTCLVCRAWRRWHISNEDEEAGRLWQEVAARLVHRDFGPGAVDSLYDADLHASCCVGDPAGNAWFEIAQRVAHCEYWQVPEDVRGVPCAYVLLDLSRSDVLVVGAAALQDSRPLVLPRAPRKEGDDYVAAVVSDVKGALSKLLGSWTWLRFAPGTRLVLLEDKDLRWQRHRAAIKGALTGRAAAVAAGAAGFDGGSAGAGTELDGDDAADAVVAGGVEFLDPLAAAFIVTGSPHGLVVDGGRTWTRVLPVCLHQPQVFASTCVPNGGDAVTALLRRQLQAAGFAVRSEDAEVAKRAACFVLPTPTAACGCVGGGDGGGEGEAGDANAAGGGVERRLETVVDFGDGRTVALRHERHAACEVIFDPRLDGHDYEGVAVQLAASVQRCGIDTRRPLLANVFLLGSGFSRLPGFQTRLRRELAAACGQPEELVQVAYHGSKTQLYPYLGACIHLEVEEGNGGSLNDSTP